MIWYYLRTGFFDTWRAKRPLLANIVVVAGICLPVLLLLGLRRGLVQQFREDLLRSPTACEITVQSTQPDSNFTVAREQALQTGAINAAVVIPVVNNALYDLSDPATNLPPVSTTFICTKPGDFVLKFYGVDVLAAGDRGVVISTAVADKLNIRYVSSGAHNRVLTSPATLWLSVHRDKDPEIYNIETPVRGVVQGDFSTGYLDRQMIVWLEQFKQGMAVPELKDVKSGRSLPSSDHPPRAGYDGFLSFTKTPLDSADIDRLYDVGLTAKELPVGADDPRRTLYGLLSDSAPGLPPMHVYWLYASLKKGTEKIDKSALEVEKVTKGDCVVVPWSVPQVLNIDGSRRTVIGISLVPRFLKSYFRNRATRLEDEDIANVMLINSAPQSVAPVAKGEANLQMPAPLETKKAPVQAQIVSVSQLPDLGPSVPPLAIVSATMAAHLGRVREGMLDFDEAGGADHKGRFVVPRIEPQFSSARMYAGDIQDVPEMEDSLRRMGYLASANTTRVKEMLNYSRTLDLMVVVVFASVMSFGILTVLFVFSDLTYRKRGAIGIMRIMGMPRPGVLFFFIVRSMVIGMGGALLAVPVGYGLAQIVMTRWNVGFSRSLYDVGLVLLGALATTLIGGGWPSWKTAYRLDPVDAIANARVQ